MFLRSVGNKLAAKRVKRLGKPVDKRAETVTIYQAMCMILLFNQMAVYNTLTVSQTVASASWWVTVLEVIPAFALFFLMRWVLKLNPGKTLMSAIKTQVGTVVGTVMIGIYAVLLLLDAWMSLHLITSVTAAYVFKNSVFRFIGYSFVFGALATVLISGIDGTARMVYLMFKLIFVCMTIIAVASLQMGNIGNLYPMLSVGIENIVPSYINYAGATWVVVLMGFVPLERDKPATWRTQKPTGAIWIAMAIIGIAQNTFCHCVVMPYDQMQYPAEWSDRMINFLRSSPSKIIWEMYLILAMTIYQIAISGDMAMFSYLFSNITGGKIKRYILALVFAALLAVTVNYHYDEFEILFANIAPYRYPLAALPLIVVAAVSLVRKKVAQKEAAQ